jgi:glycosyltransferase involved in cell wall biosynthesis
MSRTRKLNKYKTNKSKRSNKHNKTIKNNQTTARIIIKDNIGGIVADKDSIKELLESKGFKVEVVVYNDIKDTKTNHTAKTKVKFNNVDIQLFIEHIILEHPLKTFPSKKSYIFINQEYIQDWDIARMLDKTVIPLCKTQEAFKTLYKLGITNAIYVGFGNNNQFKYINKIDKLNNLFIHIVGSSPMKGTKTLINTWIYKKINYPLIITGNNKSGGNTNLFNYWKSLKPKLKDLPDSILDKWEEWKQLTNANDNAKLPKFENIDSIYFCNTVLDYNVIQFLQVIGEIHMCPSLIEGWGQYIDEGRRSKSVVVTLNAPPMNELIKNGKTGILVKASKGPSMRQLLPYGWIQYFTKNKTYNKFLYSTYKTTVNDLYNSINSIIKMSPEQKRKLGINAFTQSQKDYELFTQLFLQVILDK